MQSNNVLSVAVLSGPTLTPYCVVPVASAPVSVSSFFFRCESSFITFPRTCVCACQSPRAPQNECPCSVSDQVFVFSVKLRIPSTLVSMADFLNTDSSRNTVAEGDWAVLAEATCALQLPYHPTKAGIEFETKCCSCHFQMEVRSVEVTESQAHANVEGDAPSLKECIASVRDQDTMVHWAKEILAW